MIEHPFAQGSDGWQEARRGVITASRAKDARDRKKNGDPSDKMLAYAMDVARERKPGGRAAPVFVNAAMRMGSEEEQFAAIEYMARTGSELSEAYFITTPDRKFGASLDRWIGKSRKKALEVKTLVSSAAMFRAIVDGDISDYRDQCVFSMWLLTLDWIDLCLWCPDLQFLHIVRINRDEEEIQRMEDDMVAFEKLVTQYETKLGNVMAGKPAADAPAKSTKKPAAAPALIEPTF